MLIFVYGLLLLSFHRSVSGYIETVHASGCEACSLYLKCRMTAIIAILEVNFQATPTALINWTNYDDFSLLDLRVALNKRCSGINHCSFILAEDCPACEPWGPGLISVKYACITDGHIKKYCNTLIELPDENTSGISDGFIHSPGYPRVYSGRKDCNWIIRAPRRQQIRITVLDISVSVEPFVTEEKCPDHLDLIDSDIVVNSLCHQQEPPTQLISSSNEIKISLLSQYDLNPSRGVLIRFSAIGCHLPNPPTDGYLVHSDKNSALFSCCSGYVFSDTGFRTRTIVCLGSEWNPKLPLPACQRAALPPPEPKVIHKRRDMASEMLAPALLIVALFILNSVVIFYIYRARQKNASEIKDEELGSLPLTESHVQNV